MFAHPPRPIIELHTCVYAHVPSMWSVHANPARAGRVCTPFAARLQLTRNPKIRNPNPNPAVRTESAEYGHAFSYSSRFQTRTACILVLCIVHHRTLVGSGHQTHAGRSIGSDVGRVRTPSISTVSRLYRGCHSLAAANVGAVRPTLSYCCSPALVLLMLLMLTLATLYTAQR